MREVPGHHSQARPAVRRHEPSVSLITLGAQDPIDQATKEPYPPTQDPSNQFRVCIDIPSLNRAAAQGLFQPMAVGWRRAFPSGLRNAAATYQHFVQQAVGAQEAQRQAVLTEQDQDPRDR